MMDATSINGLTTSILTVRLEQGLGLVRGWIPARRSELRLVPQKVCP